MPPSVYVDWLAVERHYRSKQWWYCLEWGQLHEDHQ